MPTNNNNKTDKKHRTEKKELKRNSTGLNFNTQASVSDSSSRGNQNIPVVTIEKKKKKGKTIPTPPKRGKIYDPAAERLKKLRKSNSLVALGAGIADTVKAIKNRKKS